MITQLDHLAIKTTSTKYLQCTYSSLVHQSLHAAQSVLTYAITNIKQTIV